MNGRISRFDGEKPGLWAKTGSPLFFNNTRVLLEWVCIDLGYLIVQESLRSLLKRNRSWGVFHMAVSKGSSWPVLAIEGATAD